ncbi:MAG TPA: hypothetical protein DCQ29_03415 [Chitinophagaceae bacterium]|nr:hypothetical protein [Chitinophagaceae bacterium]
MSPKVLEAAQAVIQSLESTKDAILVICEDEQMLFAVANRCDIQLKQMANSIRHQFGLKVEANTTPIHFEPLTQLEGRDLTVLATSEKVDTEPTNDELETLKEKVLALEKSFRGNSKNETLLSRIKTNEDVLAIRGLAKKWKVSDFESVAIDIALIEDIRNRIYADDLVKEGDVSALIALINQADTKEKVLELTAGNENEKVQKAAMDRVIELGE